MSKYFPFSAIVGQEQMKLALILTAIDPKIGGVLVFGDRGTGKSTIVRALTGLLPKKKFVQDCQYNCQNLSECNFNCKTNNYSATIEKDTPVIDLPLGSTEDRVVGALNLEIALSEGRKVFEPGLLAKANNGYLYVDEVNLLEDHIVDLLLDVAASGENLVERDGMSIRHNSKFVLIGSGNPEEGELRPQLLDRFGLSVKVGSPSKIPERVEVVKRRDDFEQDPDAFLKKWRRKDLAIRKKILTARNNLTNVRLDDKILSKCAELCISIGSDGLRGELTLLRTLRAFTAYKEKIDAELSDLKEIAVHTLSHRLRRDPLDESSSEMRVERKINELLNG
jgi:magnesium chelatase subunit I|tara:strand:+ start:1271 stop:2281 length:1011 start_codon:yes stop_codon:yes gene_type:complete